jgi:hypothetical protein
MPNILVRDLTEEELERLDARARILGLSRSEYVRRRLRQDPGVRAITRADLERFAEAHADLAEESVMARAWR